MSVSAQVLTRGAGATLAPRSTHEVSAIVRDTPDEAPLRIVGTGGWLSGGGPFADATPLSVRAVAGVVEYVPGDLVITVRAGTTLAELAAVTAEHGQMLAAAPYGDDTATVGAFVSTGTASPLALGDLGVRDLVLGLEAVTGTGAVMRAGGRVVKNVAGFDLVRLLTGAHGTLGVITEVSLRLHARPLVDEVLVGALDDVDTALPLLVANRAPLPMIVRITPDGGAELWARVSGNAARAEALAARLSAFGARTLARVEQIDRLRRVERTAGLWRARTAPGDVVALVRASRHACPHATLLVDPARGVVQISAAVVDASPVDVATAIEAEARRAGVTHAVQVVQLQGRRQARMRTPLEAGLKQALDPRCVLNRLENLT
jgi:glycolate oxidase FAD binding subunit